MPLIMPFSNHVGEKATTSTERSPLDKHQSSEEASPASKSYTDPNTSCLHIGCASGPAQLVDSTGEKIHDIQQYALIGNLRTSASVSISGSIESYCIPNFDSPSVFARIIDADKGGHFWIRPTEEFKPKQYYAPNSNVLITKFLSENSVGSVTDLLVRREKKNDVFLPWLIRKVESLHGTVTFQMQCAPAFNYCRDEHTAEIVEDSSSRDDFCHHRRVVFNSQDLKLDLRWVVDSDDEVPAPEVDCHIYDIPQRNLLGPAATSEFTLQEGQVVYFVLRQVPENSTAQTYDETFTMLRSASVRNISPARVRVAAQLLCPEDDPMISVGFLENLIRETDNYWIHWIQHCKYNGRWREDVRRSALVLKMLVYEPTGAIVAAPTFSLPEYIGGTRNWDYRFTWVRDTSFTVYAFIRLGFTEEARAYVDFILDRLKDRNSDGSLQIVYTIHGGKDLPEIELTHLAGHKGSRPVRIGNGAVEHIQLDIYGELMDCIYLAQKFSRPLPWESWTQVRQVVDYVVTQVDQKDLSIWEVRGQFRNYTYSKVMMWVALDRGIRLAEKRCLPCPNKDVWLKTRDRLYETIQERSWNPRAKVYGQSYEDNDVLDSAVLVMPLVFFISGADPRFTSTLDQILKTPEKGGLTINHSIFRYDVRKTDDGVGGAEGAFSLCTLWGVEALTRAGAYEPKYLETAVTMFIEFLGYGNHVHLYSEEISAGGEGLGNTPQAFSHVTLISAAFNLDRTLEAHPTVWSSRGKEWKTHKQVQKEEKAEEKKNQKKTNEEAKL